MSRFYRISDVGEIQLRVLANMPIDENELAVWVKSVLHDIVYSEITQE